MQCSAAGYIHADRQLLRPRRTLQLLLHTQQHFIECITIAVVRSAIAHVHRPLWLTIGRNRAGRSGERLSHNEKTSGVEAPGCSFSASAR